MLLVPQETHSTATYAVVKSFTSPATLKEAHKLLRYDDDVIRFMTTKQSR